MERSVNFGNERITLLREILNLSQSEFAQSVGISQGALSQIENGKSQVSFRTLHRICLRFAVNCNWLVVGEGKVFLSQKESSKNPYGIYPTKVMQEDQKTLIPLIRQEAKAGYIKGYEDQSYLDTLEVYQIPGFEKGNYRMFEIEGDSMIPTFYPREIVVSEEIEDWESVENGSICIIVTAKGIVAKRFYTYEDQPDTIVLKSDNPEYKTYSISRKEINEIWGIKAKITSVFAEPNPSDDKRISNLESSIDDLRSEIASLKKKSKNGKG